MPTGGQNRKPTALKVLQGTDQPCRMPENEPKPRPIIPEPPPGLDRYGKEAWNYHAPMLWRLGVMTEADAALLWTFCQRWAVARRAQNQLNRMSPTDDGYRKVALTVENAMRDLRLLAVEFGLTPAGRSRLNVPGTEDEADDNALERLWTTK